MKYLVGLFLDLRDKNVEIRVCKPHKLDIYLTLISGSGCRRTERIEKYTRIGSQK